MNPLPLNGPRGYERPLRKSGLLWNVPFSGSLAPKKEISQSRLDETPAGMSTNDKTNMTPKKVLFEKVLQYI